MKRWFVAAVLMLAAWHGHSADRPPGVIAAEAPLQQPLEGDPPRFQKNGYTLIPLVRFTMTARVLRTERYELDREAELAPVDIVFGWGTMSDSSVLARVDINQSKRFYQWGVQTLPVARRDIETQSANMHLIPADAVVEAQIARAQSGDLAQLTGYLVEARAADGWIWKSSLTREDTGAGACELVWVEKLELH